jgi:hypothetical protein
VEVNSIRLKFQNRFAAFENMDDDDDDDDVAINRALGHIRENMKASATDSPGYYEMQKNKVGLMIIAQNYQMKGRKLNCSSCRIQA